MVEVFKTNIHEQWRAEKITELLYRHFPMYKINFDLEDCDRILRIEGEQLSPENVKMIVRENGFICEILE